MNTHSLSAVSFRDPAGFVYSHHGELLRQVNQVYREHYDRLISSGLYDELVQAGLLIRHEELSIEAAETGAGVQGAAARAGRVHLVPVRVEL